MAKSGGRFGSLSSQSAVCCITTSSRGYRCGCACLSQIKNAVVISPVLLDLSLILRCGRMARHASSGRGHRLATSPSTPASCNRRACLSLRASRGAFASTALRVWTKKTASGAPGRICRRGFAIELTPLTACCVSRGASFLASLLIFGRVRGGSAVSAKQGRARGFL